MFYPIIILLPRVLVVMAKVEVLEESMNNFMKQQSDQMREIGETVGNACQVNKTGETQGRQRCHRG